MSRWLAIAVLCTGVLAGSAQVASAQNAQADPGRIIADTVFAAGDGRPIRLGDYRGKVVFVDFWGAWCAPCVSEAASLKQLQQSLGEPRRRHRLSVCLD